MKIFSFLISITIVFSINAQTECSYFHRKFCDLGEGQPMKYDGQSKSAIFSKGQISEFHMIAYDGLDYRISLCSEEILGPEVQFKIFEKRKELIKAGEQEEAPQSYQAEVQSESAVDPNQEPVYDEYSTGSFDDYSDDSYDDAYDDYSESTDDSPAKSGPQYRRFRELLYDNSEDGFNPMIEFTAQGSMSLILQVIVPGEENSANKLKIREMGCVGVLIEHTQSSKTGF